MIQPVEMRRTLPITLHGGAMSTTTEVWDMLLACRDGDSQRVVALLAHRPELATCQFNYTPPLHFAVREGHLAIVRMLIERQALDPEYKSYPFGHSFLAMAEDRGHEEVAQLLRETLSRPESLRKWPETGEVDYG